MISGLIAGGVSALFAAAVQTAPPPICETDTDFRAFDFWLGTWDVRQAQSDAIVGRNVISSEDSGCTVTEFWTNAQGQTGRSLNFYDPTTGLWRQVWTAAGGNIIDISGAPEGPGTMVLTGHITTFRTGLTQPFRGSWSLLDDGRVRQFFELKADETAQWQPWFDGYYTRVDGAN